MNTTKDTNPQHIVIADSNNHGEPDNGFDALTGWGSGHSNHNTLIYSTLFKTDENGTIINDLATNYTISSDGLIWTVNIRDDVKFSNNKTLDAEDVAFSFNTAKNSSTELDLTNLNYAKAIDNTFNFSSFIKYTKIKEKIKVKNKDLKAILAAIFCLNLA